VGRRLNGRSSRTACGAALRAEGRILVEITHHWNRSRAETSGGLVQIGAR
jgi:hypothetical protein